MRVFVTGATGFIGSAVIRELLDAGHQVLGLYRSAEKAAALSAAGAELIRGSIEDLDVLRAGAAATDGVIHLAFNHDFSRRAQNCEDDRNAIAALGEALAGSGRPLLMTSGTGLIAGRDGAPATERDLPGDANPRGASERVALALGDRGVNASVVRLPQVHDRVKQGLVTYAIAVAREKGVLAYVGDGRSRWPAAHVSDVARIYRLALERSAHGACYHAVAEEGVAVRDMFEVIGPQIGVPVRSITPDEAQAQYGFLGAFVSGELLASSAWTRETLDWTPTEPTMLEDLARLQLG